MSREMKEGIEVVGGEERRGEENRLGKGKWKDTK